MSLRRQLVLSGGLGVVGGAALTGSAVLLLRRASLESLVSGLPGWLLLAFLLLFSLGEIPVMILAMRYMIDSPSGRWLAALTNAAFTFFAAVYALPFILLTGQVAVGVALAALSVVRLTAALWFLPGYSLPGSIAQSEPVGGNISHRARNHDLRIN